MPHNKNIFKAAEIIIFSLLCILFPVIISGTAAGATSLKKATFIPQWVPQAQFAGYYVALESGIYWEYGLDVEIISGGPNRSSSAYLVEEKADFASLWLATGIDLYDQGIEVVNLAQIVQKSALMLIAKKESGINHPSDINGRKVSLWGPPFEIQARGFFEKYQITVTPVQQSYSINLFLRDGVDVVSAMWYNEYHRIINAGLDPDELTTIFFHEHGFNYPEDGIYVLKKTISKDPALCRAFVEASLKGWRKAFAEPELALDITMRNLQKEHIITNRIHQKWMLERMRDIIMPPGAKMGKLEKNDFLRTAGDMQRQNLIEVIPNFADFYQPGVE